jgi:ABC-type multidrug transport system fused ATPase/permease subunit
LIERFYDIERGSILIDGKEIKDYNLKWLRSKIGLVSQEPILFNCSVADNIRWGKEDATDEEIINAAKMANAHQFISEFENGYETQVGERGYYLYFYFLFYFLLFIF